MAKNFSDELWEMEMQMNAEKAEQSTRYGRNAATVRRLSKDKMNIQDDSPKRKKKKLNKNSVYGEQNVKPKKKKKHVDPTSKEGIFNSLNASYIEDDVFEERSIIGDEITRRSGDDNSYFDEDREPVVNNAEEVEEETTKCTFIEYNQVMKRLTVYDAVAPYSVNLNMLYDDFNDDFVSTTLEAEDGENALENWITSFYLGFICTRHPMAICTKEEFVKLFKSVTDFNRNKFFFAIDEGGRVYCYDIADSSIESLVAIEGDYDIEELLRIYYTMFILGKTAANTFMYADEDYINLCRKNVCDNDEFANTFLTDGATKQNPNTKISDDNFFECMDVLSLEGIIGIANHLVDVISMDEEELGEDSPSTEETNETPIGVYSEEEISPDTKPTAPTSQPVKVVAKKATLNTEEEIDNYVKDAVTEDELDDIFYNKGKKEEEEIVEDYDPTTPLSEEVVSPEQAANLAQKMMGGKTEPVKVEVKATKAVVNVNDSSDDDLDTPIKTFN